MLLLFEFFVPYEGFLAWGVYCNSKTHSAYCASTFILAPPPVAFRSATDIYLKIKCSELCTSSIVMHISIFPAADDLSGVLQRARTDRRSHNSGSWHRLTAGNDAPCA